jgi:hypothetical protein
MAVEGAGGDLTPECLEHLVSCATCRLAYERALAVSRLMSLKRYEMPDPEDPARCVMAVRARIEAGEGRWLGWLDLLETPWFGAVRYASAAVALLLVLGAAFATGRLPALRAPALVVETPRRAAGPAVVMAPAPTGTLYGSAPLVFIGAPSNREPSRIQYGPSSSRLVGFEY